jgi:hypothetical protein
MRYLLIVIFIISCLQINSQTVKDPMTHKRQVQLPYNRLIQPAGLQIVFGDEALENHALDVVLSPDGKWLAVEERYSIIFISTSTNKVVYRLPNNLNSDLSGGMNTYSGIRWYSESGKSEVYWSVVGVNNRSFVASAKWDGQKAEFGRLFEYQAVTPADIALPNELLIQNEFGKKYLYVVLNGNNRVIKQDLERWSCLGNGSRRCRME